jgi:periplasmic divalent cation tolerance protein
VTDFIQVVTTVAHQDDAHQLAQSILEQRLAACVQIVGPVTSTYWWQDEIETAEEWLCILKSRRDDYPALENAIRDVHPYAVPEILATPVVAGYPPYLTWLGDTLAAGAS